jgi:hypothetical protein
MSYSLRYEEIDRDGEEGWVFHLGNVDGSTPCGARPTDPMPVADHVAQALDMLLSDHDYGEMRWCMTCVGVLARTLAARVAFAARQPVDRHAFHVDPEAPLSPADERALADLAAALDPDPRGENQ